MADTIHADIVIIGAGIVGLATARALARLAGATICVLEAEDHVGAHQTGHNSGVIHAGLYYKPGSLKAALCSRGRDMMYDFCRTRDIPHENCTKVVVATSDDEIPRLETLLQRARANGLEGVRRISVEELREREPHACGVAALHVPQTGIVDYALVARAYAAEATEAGIRILTRARVNAIEASSTSMQIHTPIATIHARHLISCAGLQADRVARLAGAEPAVRIIPFRGEYWYLRPAARRLVRNLIYPVPNPKLPFLGVHLTRTVHGDVDAGPNAVLAMGRHAYRRRDVSLRDLASMISDPRLWLLLCEHAKPAVHEAVRSVSKRAFAHAVQRLVPELRVDDLTPGPAGVRAQAVDANGRLVDDFAIMRTERAIHVLNAPSPAATASLAIGEHIARLAIETFGLQRAHAA